MGRFERLREGWQKVAATFLALAVAAAPLLAMAQGAPERGEGAGGPGGGGTGAGGPAGGVPAAEDGTGRGVSWLVLLLAIALVVYMFARRRQRGTLTR